MYNVSAGDIMNIDLIKLRSNVEKFIEINETLQFTKEDLKDSELLELLNVEVKGDITKDSLNEYFMNITINGTMILPCSLTLKPVKVDFETNVSDYLQVLIEEIDEKQKNIGNSIDIFPIIWENILMEIPMKVVSNETSDIQTEGNGWKLISGEEENINPEFEKLNDLFKKEV